MIDPALEAHVDNPDVAITPRIQLNNMSHGPNTIEGFRILEEYYIIHT